MALGLAVVDQQVMQKIRNQIHQKGQQLLSGIALPELMEICW